MGSIDRANVYVHTPDGPKRLIKFSEDKDDRSVYIRVYSGLNFNNPAVSILEHRFSVHPTDQSKTHTMIKRHLFLEGEKESRSSVCMTDAIKKGSGFTPIVFTKFTDLGNDLFNYVDNNYQDISLGDFQPKEEVMMAAIFLGHKDSIFPEIGSLTTEDQPYVGEFSRIEYRVSDFNLVIISVRYNYPATLLGSFHERKTTDPKLVKDEMLKAFHRERMKAFSVQGCLDFFSHSAIWYLREHLITWHDRIPDGELKQLLRENIELIEVELPPYAF